MFCANCGNKLEEGANFCAHCGKPVASNVAEFAKLVEEIPEPVSPSMEGQPVETEEPLPAETFPEPIPQPTMAGSEPVISNSTVQQAGNVPSSFVRPQRKGFKKLYIILAAVFVVIAVSGGLILKWYTSPAQKFSRAVEQADYATASNQYGRMSPQEQDAALNQLANMAWDAVQDYSGGGATYEEVGQWLESLTTSYFPQLEGYAPEIFDMLESLHTAKEHIEKAEAAESGGDLPTALSEYEASLAASSELADDLGPDPEELNAKIQNIEQKYKSEIIEQAKALADQKDFSGAATLLRESQSVLGGDEEIQSLLNEYGDQQTEADISALLNDAETKVKMGDYAGAISDLQGAVITDSRITTKLAEYKSGYEKQALEETEELAKSGKYEEAVAKLNQVTTVLGETDTLLSKIREYQDLCPVSLTELNAVKGDPVICDNVETDIYGNKTSGQTLRFSLWSGKDSNLEYAPNGKFKFLSGRILISPSETLKGNIKLYADGTLKFSQEGLTQKTEPIDFEIDIEKAKFIRIEASGSTGVTDFGSIYLDNPMFHN